MNVNWRAVALGFVTALVLGLVGGWLFSSGDANTGLFSYGFVGIVAGLVAGYVAKDGLDGGALNGGLATTIGGIIVFAGLALFGLLFEGLVASFTIAVVGLMVVLLYAIPGALGGAIGGWLEGRRTERTTTATPR